MGVRWLDILILRTCERRLVRACKRGGELRLSVLMVSGGITRSPVVKVIVAIVLPRGFILCASCSLLNHLTFDKFLNVF